MSRCTSAVGVCVVNADATSRVAPPHRQRATGLCAAASASTTRLARTASRRTGTSTEPLSLQRKDVRVVQPGRNLDFLQTDRFRGRRDFEPNTFTATLRWCRDPGDVDGRHASAREFTVNEYRPAAGAVQAPQEHQSAWSRSRHEGSATRTNAALASTCLCGNELRGARQFGYRMSANFFTAADSA